KSRGICGADVSHNIVHMLKECLETDQIILDRIRIGGEFVLSSVPPNDYSVLFLQLFGGLEHPFVVKAHTVYDGLVPQQPEQSLSWVSGLWLGGHRTDLNKSKSKIRKFVIAPGILVKTRRQAHRIPELQTKNLPFQVWFDQDKDLSKNAVQPDFG